jgi:hypothetical protein
VTESNNTQNNAMNSLLLLRSTVLYLLAVVAAGDYALFTNLNNGIAEAGLFCLHDEWDAVQDAMDNAVNDQRRRNLRATERRLTSLAWCQSACADVASGFCHVVYPRCKKHKLRRMQEFGENVNAGQDVPEYNTNNEHRALQQDVTKCQDDLIAVNNSLNEFQLLPNTTAECQALLSAPRNYTCLEVANCEVTKFSLWNADTKKVMSANFSSTGYSTFCRTNSTITIRAVARFCVDSVKFTLTGPNNYLFTRTDLRQPFYLYQHSGPNLRGERLAVGNYTLSATAVSDRSLSKTTQFGIRDC